MWDDSPSRYLGVPLEHYRDNDEYWRVETEALHAKATKCECVCVSVGGTGLSTLAHASACNAFLAAKVW